MNPLLKPLPQVIPLNHPQIQAQEKAQGQLPYGKFNPKAQPPAPAPIKK
jgi:hypothetical protein